MSLLRKLERGAERRDYLGGTLTNPWGAPNYDIPTNGELAYIDGIGSSYPASMTRAMRHWAVWACVRIICDAASALPIDAYSGDAVPIEPTPTRIEKPSAYATRIQWVWQALASGLLRGNSYGLIGATDRLEYPTQVDLISPDSVRDVRKDKAGHKVFDIGNETLSSEQVWHMPGPQLPGDLKGMAPISYAARTIGLGLDAEGFGADYFKNGIHPTAIASSDQPVDEAQAKTIKKRIKEAVAGRDLAVLGMGISLKPWQITAEESQFLDTQQMNAVAISQIFGVPPEMIGAHISGRTLTYANREQRAQDFLQGAVNPWLARLEESLSAWFPRGTYVKFNTGALLRSDLLTRYQSYQVGIRSNFLLPSEARALEDLPVIEGIDDKPLTAPAVTPAPATDPNNQGQGK